MQEGDPQHLEVSGTAVHADLAQAVFRRLQHRHHQAVTAMGALPGAIRGELQGGGQLLYSSVR